MKHEKMMHDIQRLLAEQDFKNEDELNAYMNQLVGKKLPPPSKKNMSPAEWAKELIFEAYEMDPDNGFEHVLEALEIDPDSIEGYEYLGNTGEHTAISLAFYEKGVALGDKQFGGEYLEDNKGDFWGMHETRPYMRCLQMTAEILGLMGKSEGKIATYEKMIKLNSSDNQGVRAQLGISILEVGDLKKFKHYDQLFDFEDRTSSNFNRALAQYKSEGASPEANKMMQIAVNSNSYVVSKLNSKKDKVSARTSYILGSKDEATVYSFFAQDLWRNIKGALVWSKGFKKGK
jgi:hypothetical protein